MAATFNAQWAEHGAWKRDFCFLLRLFSQWLKDNALLDAASLIHIQRLEQRVGSEKLMVALVAEFSRGKSELINAMFFSDYGRRIMPTGAGRTTMCPTEIGYEPNVPAHLRLLPIQTRLQAQSLHEWRKVPQSWTYLELDAENPEQMAKTINRVTETIRVTPEEAKTLGLWQTHTFHGQGDSDESGMVQIPKWRHAVINIEHPLLEQGLVILDTPGLNALGAEPDLTMGLLDQAQAHIFILSADTGVSRTDLALWEEHMEPHLRRAVPTLVVLNKIDTLWDELSSEAQIQGQIRVQIDRTAQILGIEASKVVAVSAQKGLVARISKNSALLQKSGILALETALCQGMLAERQRIVRESLKTTIAELRTCLEWALDAKISDMQAQRVELESLRGQSHSVLLSMKERIKHEQWLFEQANTRMAAIKSVYRKLYQQILEQLRPHYLVKEMQVLEEMLRRPGLKWDAKKIYAETFDRLKARAKSIQTLIEELQSLQTKAFRQLNADYGFSLNPVITPRFLAFEMDLELAKRSQLAYVGIRHTVLLQSAEYVERIVRALFYRLDGLLAAARSDAHQWRRSVLAQLETQTTLRRANFTTRLETIEKIERAADGFELRWRDIVDRELAAKALRQKLGQQIVHLSAASEDALTSIKMLHETQ